MKTFEKDPNDLLDYQMNWAAWLGVSDTIVNSVWIVPTALTSSLPSNTTTTATIWLTGGVDGTDYMVTNRIVTAGGRQRDWSFTLAVRAH